MFGSVAGLLSAFNLANKRGGGGEMKSIFPPGTLMHNISFLRENTKPYDKHCFLLDFFKESIRKKEKRQIGFS